jgi:hypothetical protein
MQELDKVDALCLKQELEVLDLAGENFHPEKVSNIILALEVLVQDLWLTKLLKYWLISRQKYLQILYGCEITLDAYKGVIF